MALFIYSSPLYTLRKFENFSLNQNKRDKIEEIAFAFTRLTREYHMTIFQVVIHVTLGFLSIRYVLPSLMMNNLNTSSGFLIYGF